HVGGAFRSANGGKADPDHGYTLRLHHRDHLFDLLAVKLDPALVAKFIETIRRTRGLFRRGHRRRVRIVGVVLRQFGVGRLVVWLGRIIGLAVGCGRLGLLLGASVLLLALLVGGFLFVLVGLLARGLAQRHAVVEAKHHDDDIGLLGRENASRRGGPIGGF